MVRRAFDTLAAGIGLVVLSPLLLAVAVAVASTSRGPVFFRQERVGLGGRTFRIHKFRTMRVDAERMGGQLTVGADPRVTGVGRMLRATKIDELPQLIDVLKGDMALVGPRPEVPRFVAHYTAAQRRVLEVRPGITDPASIAYRDEGDVLARAVDPEHAYLDEVMPHKLAINLAYLERRTLASDIGVIFATLARLVRRRPHDEGPRADGAD
ncbi:MAG: sugar transferase [Trueperaceae bacterium]|nr:sugar transferase [Trueperaceae bacterium]